MSPILQALIKRAATFLDLPGIGARAYRKGQQEERARVVRLLRARAAILEAAHNELDTAAAVELRDVADAIEGP